MTKIWRKLSSLLGVSPGYLPGLNNMIVSPMYEIWLAGSFGFTEDEISILLQHNNKKVQLDDVRKWYDGYRAGNGIHLYNPCSINSYIEKGTLETHWVNTGKHCT